MSEDLHIYLRVSSDVQSSDGFGLENQKELGLKVSELKGMNPIIHNEGSKSSHLETIEHRPILRELLYRMDEGDVKNLWVYQMDRLSRNDVVSFQIRQKIKQNGVRLYVNDTNEFELDNPTDKLMFTIMEGISEFDNSIRTERLRRGKLSKIKKGGWKGGPPPFGYKIVDGKLEIEPSEMRWVRTIYEDYGKGETIYTIKRKLMKNGVLSRRGNVVWSEPSIRRILLNTHFEGFYTYEDKELGEMVRCECPSMDNPSLIKKVRQRFEKNTKTSNYVKTVTLLKHKLVCGHCGSKFGQKINKKQFYNHYYCRGNTERLRRNDGIDQKVCVTENGRVRSLNIEDCDEVVWNTVVDVLSDSSLFKESFKKEVMSEKTSFGQSQNERKKIQRRISKINEQIADINDSINSMIVEGVVDRSSEELKPLIKKFDGKKLELESEKIELIDSLQHNKKNTEWYNWIKDFGSKIDNLRTEEMTTEERIKFLDGVVEKIVVTTKDKQTHNIQIVFKTNYVGDELVWSKKGQPKKGYTIKDGKNDIDVDLISTDKRLKKSRNNGQ